METKSNTTVNIPKGVLAKEISNGVCDCIMNVVGWFIVGAAVMWLFVGLFNKPDDSDKSSWDRSGFAIMTDARTGLQYLKAGAALTPRLDVDGKQIRDNKN